MKRLFLVLGSVLVVASIGQVNAEVRDRPETTIVKGYGSVVCPNGFMLTGVASSTNKGWNDQFHIREWVTYEYYDWDSGQSYTREVLVDPDSKYWPPSANPVICQTIGAGSASNCTTLKQHELVEFEAVCVKACG